MSVKVAVRCRPLTRDEQENEQTIIVRMQNSEVEVMNTYAGRGERFCFDVALWSVDNASHSDRRRQCASQETVYMSVASDLMNHFLAGYNGCIFAYGQTGSGKTYSMIGTPKHPGVIPRVAKEIFSETNNSTRKEIQTCVEVSFFEIYNETVRCLLCPKDDNSAKPTMRVREHPKFGPFIEGLTKLVVSSEKEFLRLLDEGNKVRSVASTAMNASSSRSHAIFVVMLTQKQTNGVVLTTKISKLNLVDLAGSERASKAMSTGKRFVEGTNINKSLTCLGNVISSLAEKQESGKSRHVPYRDSLLTWILKDNLGGNSRTVMLATISPSILQYDETISTLRYADRAKKIVNCAVINESSNNELIFALQKEIEQLKAQVQGATDIDRVKLMEQLATSEAFHKELNMSLEEKLYESRHMMELHRRHMLELEKQLEAQRCEIMSLRKTKAEKERHIKTLLHKIKDMQSHDKDGKGAERMDELLKELAALESDKNEQLNEFAQQDMAVLRTAEDIAARRDDFVCAESQRSNVGPVSVRDLIKTFESMGSESQVVKQNDWAKELMGINIVSQRAGFYEGKNNKEEILTPLRHLATGVGKTSATEDKELFEALFTSFNGDNIENYPQIFAETQQRDSDGSAACTYEFDADIELSVDENVDMEKEKQENAVEEGGVDFDHDLTVDDDVMEEFYLRISEDGASGVGYERGTAKISELQGIEDEDITLDVSEDLFFLEKTAEDANKLKASEQHSVASFLDDMTEKDINAIATSGNDGGGGGGGCSKKTVSSVLPLGFDPESAYVLLPPTSPGPLNLPTVGTLVIPSHSVPNNRYLLEAFKVIKKSDKALLGSKKQRIWVIDVFKHCFSNLNTDGHVSFEYPSGNLLRLEKDFVNSKSLILHFLGAPHPYELEFVSSLRRQRFYEVATTLRQNSILWCPSLCLKDEKDTLVNIYGTTIDHAVGKTFPVRGKTTFMVARMPYEVIDTWYGCFSLKKQSLPQSATMLGSFLPQKSYEICIIGVMDIPPLYIGNELLGKYFVDQLGSSMYDVIANSAAQSKKRPTNNAIIVIVKKTFIFRISHIQALETTQLFNETISKGEFTAVGCALRINESSLGIMLVNAKPANSSVSLRTAVIQSMISSFPFGDTSVDIGVRFDYFIVSGFFNFGNDFRDDDVLLAKIKAKDLMSSMVEAPVTAAIMNATEPVRIFYAVRPQVSRLDVKQYSSSSSFALPNAFCLMDVFTQRVFLNVFGEVTQPLQLVFDDLFITFPERRTPKVSGPELRISGDWITNSPLCAKMTDEKNLYNLSKRAVPMVIPINSNPAFLRLQTITFSLLGLLGETDKKNTNVVASGVLPLKNSTRLGEYVNFSIPLYYRASSVGVLTGKVLLAAYEQSGGGGDAAAAAVQGERDVLLVSCYENQVRDGKCWLPAVFAQHSAHPFSAEDSAVECTMGSHALPDPATWAWLGPWHHDVFSHDPEGWRYDEKFRQQPGNGEWRCTKLSKVRRRRWTRVMKADNSLIYHNYLMSLRAC